jgi:hypothetical protein
MEAAMLTPNSFLGKIPRAGMALMLAAVAVAWLSAPAAAAEVSMPARGGLHDDAATFQVLAQYTVGSDTIQTAEVLGRIDGTFTGPYVERATSVTHRTGEADIRGTASCECTVGGRPGSVLFGFTAKAEPDGSLVGRFWIYSATGGLADLVTRDAFQSADGINGTYSGWFSLDD